MTSIQVEDLSQVKKKITLEVPEDTVTSVIDSQYRDLKKTVQLKGFRKGKVPLDIIRSYFKSQVLAEASRKIIEETFQPALDEQKIVPVSVIKIDPEEFEAGKPFKYTAEIEVPPPIEAKDYKGITIKKYIREFDEGEVDKRIKAVQERNARLSPISDRGITKADHIVADIRAEADGEPVPSLTVTDYHMEMGRDFYLAGFDANIEGMKLEETREFSMDLPADFPKSAIAGKTCKFNVILKEAKEKVLAAIDDDFARDLGAFENLEALKEEIRKDIREMQEQEAQRESEKQIIDALLETNEFEVPDSMVEQQVDRFLDRTIQSMAAHGIDPKRMPAPTEAQRTQMRPGAIRTVKAGLVLKAIGEQEHIEISDEEMNAGVEERAKQLGLTADFLKEQLERNDMLEDMKSSLLQDKIYKFIEENGNIVEEAPSAETPTEEAGKE
jgi:trigger factor